MGGLTDPTGAPPAAPASARVGLRRLADRGRYDAATVHAILDASPVCHLGFVHDGHPMVVPTLQARHGSVLYVHASTGSRLAMLAAAGPVPVSLTVTLVDGYVLARAAFHHSLNYRSVVVVGHAELVRDHDERWRALEAVTNAVAPGRWDEVRRPDAKELAATAVLRLPLAEASAKIRSGPPSDEPEDLGLDVWAGVVPTRVVTGAPIPAPDLTGDPALPASVERLRAGHP